MTHEQIKYFLEVAQCRNFTYAANRLYISLPSLSKSIKALEKEIGVPLFLRNNRGVELMQEGKLLFDTIERPFSQFITTYDRVSANLRAKRATFSIGVSAGECVNPGLLSICRQMNSKYKGHTQFVIRAKPVDNLYSELVRGNLDVIIIDEISIRNIVNVSYRPLSEIGLILAVAKNHPLAGEKNVTPDDLRDECFIVITPNNSSSKVDAVTRMEGFSAECIYVDDIQSVLLTVAAGAGVAILPDNAELYGGDEVERIPITPSREELVHDCVAWLKHRQTPIQEEFVNLLLQAHVTQQHGG